VLALKRERLRAARRTHRKASKLGMGEFRTHRVGPGGQVVTGSDKGMSNHLACIGFRTGYADALGRTLHMIAEKAQLGAPAG